MTTMEEIIAAIKEYDRIIIHRHKRPDPDAIGSQVGLAEILRNNFPEKEIYQVGGSVEGLEFLASMETIEDSLYQGALVIVTDTANSPRVSDDRFSLGDKLIKIDHHPNDDPYGDIVWVNTNASSCSEMIADLAFDQKLKLNENAARLLYGGIVGDTGRFLYPATTSHTLRVAAKLLDHHFDATKLNREIEQISLKVAKLSGYLYQNLEVDENGAGQVVLSQEIMKKYDIVDSETSSLVPLPGVIDNVMAWGLFVEQPEGYYRVRLRSKGPVINELAKKHHGGGHPLASGANAYDEKERAEIYRELQLLCAEFKR
ncbi:DHH family phosphoesterase [Enterococcus pallens]|uniref:Phosphoesterase RecJ protein n=1 Tax=Enterococcus pallens ATCC BAA-351 TaxID=1158607 RepID=R2QLD6_9ENTE|nr:bifunctional oligoribonuclease/PAP phosphatase NrnA [Enterococcus pallens]EOH96008.1 phosphoesterase RecJ protein [Enterococcus pallens ATCC BAA-351]EOU14727.1 phosphoesterase RecJ protein [Enterococcus pallens ATCC BAA-351]OJG76628.1 phosphoesterase RecJ protein [Enterococcus pallens]